MKPCHTHPTGHGTVIKGCQCNHPPPGMCGPGPSARDDALFLVSVLLLLVAVVAIAAIGSCGTAHAAPGVGVEWTAPPTPAEWSAVAGEHGFVAALSAERLEDVTRRLEVAAARDEECAAIQGALDAQADVAAAQAARIAALERDIAEREDQASQLRVDLARAEAAAARRRRWPLFVAGAGVGLAAPVVVRELDGLGK